MEDLQGAEKRIHRWSVAEITGEVKGTYRGFHLKRPRPEAPDDTSDGRSNNQIISASCEGRMTKNDLEKTLFILYGLIISREHGSGN
jgi:hypothetical protein